MKLGRRDLFKFAAGSAAGVVFTPVPWKLLEDSALWSQNWSWIPRPPRGEIRAKFTTCTLCAAACGVRVRTVIDQPVGLAGVAGHPANDGTLCALGLAGHHLPYHPMRVTQPLRRGRPVTLDAAAAAIGKALAELGSNGKEHVAVLDERPGRTASWLYRRLLAGIPNGLYLRPPARESATLEAAAAMLDAPPGPLGFDLAQVRTILSFGAPLLDGWGSPARILQHRRQFQIVQAETRQSRTAALADRWLPIRPGTEAALALGLAYVMAEERLLDPAAVSHAQDFAAFEQVAAHFRPERAAELTGLTAETIVETARFVASHRPAVAIGGGDPGGGPLGREEETAIAGLNLLLGGCGQDGGIIRRRAVPVPREWTANALPVTEIAGVPDGSLRVLFLDSAVAGDALPWSLVEKKLTGADALVVSFAAYRAGYAEHADYLIPAPMYLESAQDVPAPDDAEVASFSLSPALLTPPAGVVEPVEFLGRVLAKPVKLADEIQSRVQAVYAGKTGRLFSYSDEKSVALTEVASAEEFGKALVAGGCWIDEKAPAAATPKFRLLGKDKTGAERLIAAGRGRLYDSEDRARQFPLLLLPFGWRGATGNAVLSPVMTKVYQESGLRRVGNQAVLHPETGKACGLTHGCRAVVETECGSCGVSVSLDAAIMPGVIQVAVGPGNPRAPQILDVCRPQDGAIWRVARARIGRA